jgi:hypothetical protein
MSEVHITRLFDLVRDGRLHQLGDIEISASEVELFLPVLVLCVDAATTPPSVTQRLLALLSRTSLADHAWMYTGLLVSVLTPCEQAADPNRVSAFERASARRRLDLVQMELAELRPGAPAPLLGAESVGPHMCLILPLLLLRGALQLPFVVRVLVQVAGGHELIVALVCARPAALSTVARALLDTESPNAAACLVRVCRALAALSYPCARALRDLLQRAALEVRFPACLPALVLQMTVDNVHDEVAFLDQLLFASPGLDAARSTLHCAGST